MCVKSGKHTGWRRPLTASATVIYVCLVFDTFHKESSWFVEFLILNEIIGHLQTI